MKYLVSMLVLAMFAGLTAMADQPTAAPAASQPTTSPSADITWDQALKHAGENATVTGPVVSTHVSTDKKNVTLNVGKNFPDPTRFTVFMPYDPTAGTPDDLYKGKTVTVTGKIVIYKKAAEVKTTAKAVTVTSTTK